MNVKHDPIIFQFVALSLCRALDRPCFNGRNMVIATDNVIFGLPLTLYS